MRLLRLLLLLLLPSLSLLIVPRAGECISTEHDTVRQGRQKKNPPPLLSSSFCSSKVPLLPLPPPPLVLCSHQSRLQKSAVCVCELQCTSVYLPLQDLYAAGEGKVGTDEEKIIKILGNRSVEHLREGESVSLTGQNSLTVWKQHTFTIYSSCSLLFHLNSPDSICKGPLLFR